MASSVRKRTRRRKADDPYTDYILVGHDAAASEGPAARALSTFALYGRDDGVCTEYLLQREKREFVASAADRTAYLHELDEAWAARRDPKEARAIGAKAPIDEEAWAREREDVMLALLLHRETHDPAFCEALDRTGSCAILQKGRGEWGMAFVGGRAQGANAYGAVLEGVRASRITASFESG